MNNPQQELKENAKALIGHLLPIEASLDKEIVEGYTETLEYIAEEYTYKMVKMLHEKKLIADYIERKSSVYE